MLFCGCRPFVHQRRCSTMLFSSYSSLLVLLVVVVVLISGWDTTSSILLLVHAEQEQQQEQQQQHQHQQRIPTILVAYLPDYTTNHTLNYLNDTVLHLTDLVFWSVTPLSNGSLTATIPIEEEENNIHPHPSPTASAAAQQQQQQQRFLGAMRQARSYKQQHLQQQQEQSQQKGTPIQHEEPLRLWISVGGGGRSDDFANVVSSSVTRRILLDSLLEFCQKEELDGIDFDWEQPWTPADYRNYVLLLQEAHSLFSSSSFSSSIQQNGRRRIRISVNLHPHLFFLVRRIHSYVDHIHLMAYDNVIIQQLNKSPSLSSPEYHHHHASLEYVQTSVTKFLQQGGNSCPPSKLVIGIPLYARHSQYPNNYPIRSIAELWYEMRNNNDNNDDKEDEQLQRQQQQALSIKEHGIEQPEETTTTTTTLVPSSMTMIITTIGLWNGYRFDSLQEMKDKIDYVQQLQLGGIFVWELGQDIYNDFSSSTTKNDDEGTTKGAGIIVQAISSRQQENRQYDGSGECGGGYNSPLSNNHHYNPPPPVVDHHPMSTTSLSEEL